MWNGTPRRISVSTWSNVVKRCDAGQDHPKQWKKRTIQRTREKHEVRSRTKTLVNWSTSKGRICISFLIPLADPFVVCELQWENTRPNVRGHGILVCLTSSPTWEVANRGERAQWQPKSTIEEHKSKGETIMKTLRCSWNLTWWLPWLPWLPFHLFNMSKPPEPPALAFRHFEYRQSLHAPWIENASALWLLNRLHPLQRSLNKILTSWMSQIQEIGVKCRKNQRKCKNASSWIWLVQLRT